MLYEINLTYSKIRQGKNHSTNAKSDKHTTELVTYLEKDIVVEGTSYDDSPDDSNVQNTVCRKEKRKTLKSDLKKTKRTREIYVIQGPKDNHHKD
jgi:hypothetical protein